VLEGKSPTELEEEDDEVPVANNYVIAIEDIGSEQIGRAWQLGICPAYVLIGGDERHAEAVSGLDYLVAAGTGSSSVIWSPGAGEEAQICIVRLGTGISITIPVKNMSGETAPEGGWAEVYDWEDGYFLFRKPTDDNVLTAYILTTDIKSLATGEAWDRGITSGAILEAGAGTSDLVGSVDGQWYGRVSVGGTFVCVAPNYFQSL
jgi:hypothetical protein